MSGASTVPRDFVLIIGAMKSGTTSLFEILAQHPQVASCRDKEPDFFSDATVFARGWDWYRQLWKWSGEHRVAMEASVSYTKAPLWPRVPERIASMPGARFKFIYMLRHPLERISSQVRHGIFEGWGHGLDEGLAKDLIPFSSYAMQADRYMEIFPRDSLLMVTLEEFESDPGDVLSRICGFIGIDEDFEFSEVGRRYNKGDLYTMAPSVARLMRAPTLQAVARRVLTRSARHRIRDAIMGLTGKSAPEAAPPRGRHELNEQERAELLAALEPDLRRLRNHYGVDLERHWGLKLD